MIATVCHGIDIRNFRNIETASVTFTEGVNLLHGDNAQGKTNLLEAVYFTALGKSFRPVKEAELIRDSREGKFIYYELNASVLEEILLWISDLKKGENENDQA